MLVTAKKVLEKARKGKYAVGAFNVYNIETLQAVIRAAETLRSPVIVQTSESALAYAGLKTLAGMIISMAKDTKIPVVLHLDHGKNIDTLKKCLKAGYTSVMFDGSLLEYEKNVAQTKKVVALAQAYGASVEAELGILGGKEDTVYGENEYTNPAQAAEFVSRTGIDSLAIAIGTSHGPFKPRAHKLRFDILHSITHHVKIPLVLHGASMVDSQLIAAAKKSGLHLVHPQGVRGADIRTAIKLGITKINVDTDLRIAFTAALRSYTRTHSREINPRALLASAERSAQASVAKHIKIFGSVGKK